MLYLGEINGIQAAAWRETVDLFGKDDAAPQQVALFSDEHAPDVLRADDLPIVRIKLTAMSLRRPRQWGACWLGCELWQQLGLDAFWRERLPTSREGTRWDQVLLTLTLYRLIDPGAEWRLHRHWFDHTAIADLLGDLSLRPIYHQLESRIESHIFISFLAYCLQVTLKARLRQCAAGLTPRAVLEKFAAVQMLDVHLPTTDAREIIMSRYTQPEKDLQLLLDQMKLTLPEQGPPKITAPRASGPEKPRA